IDIYPVTEEHPIRIELFDDEVDSIRYFDAGSQRSLQKEQTVNIHPATELLLAEDDIISGVQRLEDALGKSLQKLKTPGGKEKLTEVIGYDVERLKNMERFQEMYKYIGFFYENPTSLLDYMPESGVVILDEMSRIQESANHLDTEEAEWYSSLLESNQMVHDSHFSFDWHEIWDHTNHMRIYMSVFLRHIPNTQPQNIVNLSSRAMQTFHGQMNLFKNELNRWQKGGFSIVVLAPND